MKKISIINFSSRDNGNCHNIADVCQEFFSEAESARFDFGDVNISACGNCDYECLGSLGQCVYEDNCNDIYESVATSDLSVFIVPNYCGYPNSNYFIFSERSCGFFKLDKDNRDRYLNANKKFIVVTNSNMAVLEETLKLQTAGDEIDILFLKSGAFRKNPANGDLMEVEEAKNLVTKFLSE